jgi:hypothetical protein
MCPTNETIVCLISLIPIQRRKNPSPAECSSACMQGDFWDSRYHVPHQLLEEVRCALRGWAHPTLCIAGNHDQLSRSGHRHTLGIIQDISPSWTVIEQPTLALGAAWIPYQYVFLAYGSAAGTALLCFESCCLLFLPHIGTLLHYALGEFLGKYFFNFK